MMNSASNSWKWELRYLDLAANVAQWSKDPSSKIGAVAIGADDQVLAQGYNGFPRGVEDTADRLNDREVKLKYVVHAEMNCIYNACLNGVSLKGSTLYIHGLPMCHGCTPGIIQVGIKRVVMAYPVDAPNAERWIDSWNISRTMLDESEVEFVRFGYETGHSNWLDTARFITRSQPQRKLTTL